MENASNEGDIPRFDVREHLLNSGDIQDAGTAVSFFLEDAINDVLPKIAENFSPADCADIVSKALKKMAADKNFIQDITRYIENFQAGSNDTIPITEKDLGV